VQELNVSAHVEHAPDADQHLSLIVGERYPFGVEEAQRHGALQMSEKCVEQMALVVSVLDPSGRGREVISDGTVIIRMRVICLFDVGQTDPVGGATSL